MIKRIATKTITEYLEFFPVIGIVGPRQVGKTTLVKSLMEKINVTSVYLDLEYPEDLNKLNDPVLYLEQNNDKCIIIDEVQRKPDLFPIIRSLVDRNRRPGRFIILGSASPELIRDSSESLAGRIAYVNLHPFNITEIKQIYNYKQHWFNGGFPNALLATKPEFAKIWIQQFVQTYIERDLPLLGFPAQPTITRRFWQMLAHYNGNLWNASAFSKALSLSNPTVIRYADFFEEAFLIRRLKPWNVNAKKRMVKSPKIYIRDTGLLHHLAGINDFESLHGNILIGSSWENYVIEQISQLIKSNFELFFYRTQAGAEADLIIANGIIPVCCIEIKFSSDPKVSKGFLNVINDLQTKSNYIITPESSTYPLNRQISVVNLIDFITNVLPEIQK